MLSEVAGYNDIKVSLAENYVATVLISNGYNIYYWESQGKAEVNFVIQNSNGQIIPIVTSPLISKKSKSFTGTDTIKYFDSSKYFFKKNI